MTYNEELLRERCPRTKMQLLDKILAGVVVAAGVYLFAVIVIAYLRYLGYFVWG